MQALHLGTRPNVGLVVHLTTGSDFLCVLRASEPWADGTEITLTLGSTTLTATIDGRDATLAADKAVTDAIPASTSARLTAANGTTDQVLAIGTVVRHG